MKCYGDWGCTLVDRAYVNDPDGHSGYSEVAERYHPRLSHRKCKFCGSYDVHWRMTNSGWRLYDNDTVQLHQCRDAANRTSEGFDDVSG